MLWWVGAGFFVLWAFLVLVLHKGGLIHILLLTSISMLVVELTAYRKTKYHRRVSGK